MECSSKDMEQLEESLRGPGDKCLWGVPLALLPLPRLPGLPVGSSLPSLGFHHQTSLRRVLPMGILLGLG